ncbi:MAG: ATP-binding protein [Lachnospiraceae bacterium]|nr:ATP-binding protein [Lachnospiraceae bacterium]
MKRQKMPVGVDQFEKLRQQDFYYVDKTGLIKELLENWGEVNLFTRPRRFGKSLNMSMLKSFFAIDTDKSLFDGLAISREKKLCEQYMGQFPVIFITLKQVTGATLTAAKEQLWEQIAEAADRFDFLRDSERLSSREKRIFQGLCDGEGNLEASLKQLSRMLCKHYGKKVIILIDEYDAPLQRAYAKGYYDAMVDLIRQFFGYALKTNECLYFSVLTGIMRVSKESIFSDLNNPLLYTMLDEKCDEWFGFTDKEIRQMLDDNGLMEYYETVKNWYDGYVVGQDNIYCPWDVINYCHQLLNDSDKTPRNYWANVSENGIICTFAEMADSITRDQISGLMEGGTVKKRIVQELTYRDMTNNLDNIWSILFTTGYLTQRGRLEDGTYELCIPNNEVADIFKTQINDWFQNKVREDTDGLQSFYRALDSGDAQSLEDCLNYFLGASISFMDGGTLDDKEKFYHGLVLGMLLPRKEWEIQSNRESGKGRSDITAFQLRTKEAIIIELKYSKKETDLPGDAQEAIDQINRMQYDQCFSMRKPKTLRHFGIAFYKKLCRVEAE